MGIAVCSLAKHHFDASSIQTLAAQLAIQLNVRIKYGFRDDWDRYREPTFEFVSLGQTGSGAGVMQLCQEYYPEYLQVGSHLCYRLKGHLLEAERAITIYRDSFDPDISFDMKWGSFIAPYLGKDPKGDFERAVHAYRISVLRCLQDMNCELKAWHYPDTFSNAAFLPDIAGEGTWQDILSFIEKHRETLKVLTVSEWYSQRPDLLSDPPELLYDDFRDLLVKPGTT